MFRKKDAFNPFAKFTGKHLCRSLVVNEVVVVAFATLLKRDSDTGVFL